jgi:DNA-directed RNA polymerase specialized sigma24 family protein
MNHTAYAKTVFRSRNFRIQPTDLDDVVQAALVAALSRGIDTDDDKIKGFLFISCMRHIQTTCKKKPTVAVKPTHRIGGSTQLADMIKSETLDRVLENAKSLPDGLRHVVEMTLSGMDAHAVASARQVKSTTVRVDRCRAYKLLRNLH